MYKMSVTYNAADTSRDPDDIVQVYEGFYSTKEKLLQDVKDYILKHFVNTHLANTATLSNIEDFQIMDPVSWGKVLKVTKIKVED